MNIIITAKAVTVTLDGHPHMVSRENSQFEKVIEAYRTGDEEKVRKVVDALNSVRDWASTNTSGNVQVKGGKVFYKGTCMENAVTQRILDWVNLDLNPQPMINFLERLLQNPSYQSRNELLLFLEHSNLPIQEDGRFIAYKVVRNNYMDKHSGTMDNSVGRIVEMPRGEVDDNRHNTCSAGLHFCSKDYIPHFSGGNDRLMLLAIDPADVVSIPSDYNNAKGRACKYEVVEEVKQAEDFDSPLHTGTGGYVIKVTNDNEIAYYYSTEQQPREFLLEDESAAHIFSDLNEAHGIFTAINEDYLLRDGFADADEEVYNVTLEKLGSHIVDEKIV
jgi:hypothetical protein